MEAKLRDFNEKLEVIQDFLDDHQQKKMELKRVKDFQDLQHIVKTFMEL